MSGPNEKVFLDLETRVRSFIDKWAGEFKERVEAKTPVVTGDLKKGYGITRKQTGFALWNTQSYFPFVEHGTAHMAPRRMVGRTLLEADDITRKVLKELKK